MLREYGRTYTDPFPHEPSGKPLFGALALSRMWRIFGGIQMEGEVPLKSSTSTAGKFLLNARNRIGKIFG